MTQEIILNHLSMKEQAMHNDNFEQYKQEVAMFLMIKGKFHYEKDILSEYKVKTVEELITNYPDTFIPAGKKRKKPEDEFANTWYDISEHYIITPTDSMYDLFFTYQLRNLDVLETDEFLNFQQAKYFENEIEKFKRFIHLTIRKHGKKLLTTEQIETIREWTILKAQPELSGTGMIDRTKGRLKREAGDNMTALNLQQTALLIHFMQKAKIILKGEYLNKTQAGQAFSLLTGYSVDALRLELNPEKFNLSKDNLTELHNTITRLGILIDKAIRLK